MRRKGKKREFLELISHSFDFRSQKRDAECKSGRVKFREDSSSARKRSSRPRRWRSELEGLSIIFCLQWVLWSLLPGNLLLLRVKNASVQPQIAGTGGCKHPSGSSRVLVPEAGLRYRRASGERGLQLSLPPPLRNCNTGFHLHMWMAGLPEVKGVPARKPGWGPVLLLAGDEHMHLAESTVWQTAGGRSGRMWNTPWGSSSTGAM